MNVHPRRRPFELERAHDSGRRHRVPSPLAWLLVAAAACSQSCEAGSIPEPRDDASALRARLIGGQDSSFYQLPPGQRPVRLVVKFNEGTRVRMRQGRFTTSLSGGLPPSAGVRDVAALQRELARIHSELDARGVSLRPTFGISDARLATLKAAGERRSGRPLVDLGLYHQAPASAFQSDAQMEQLRSFLASLDSVEVAYIEPEPAPPPDANTPDLTSQQGYKGAAPAGIGANFAATVAGGRGTGVRVIDIESGLRPGHEDLPAAFYTRGDIEPTRSEHAIAVAGVAAGLDNNFGITGIAPDAEFGNSSIFPFTSTSTAEAMMAPLSSGDIRPGDVMLLEVQRQGPVSPCMCGTDCPMYVPEEWILASFDVISTLTANGIIVVEAGANGHVNLDDPVYQGAFDRSVRDSGALIVGARASTDASPQCFSNSGSRVDVHAWGDSVVTTGYGILYSGELAPHDYYTASFSGTSSASAITAGGVTSLQGVALTQLGAPLTPDEMRGLLTSTGSPQTGDLARPIGVQTDLEDAIAALPGTLDPSFVEDFETGFDLFQPLPVDPDAGVDILWSLGGGSTPSSGTGPSGDHTTGSGTYAFTEASSYNVDPPGNPNMRAVLESGCLDLGQASAAQFTFFYHMLGADTGSLELEADAGCDGSGLVNLFTQVGEQTGGELNDYVRQDVDLGAFVGGSVRLRIVATTGDGYLSDIAVDDLGLQVTLSEPCQSDDECTSGVCDAGTCVECLADSDCPLDETCDLATRSCVPPAPECSADSDCDDGDPCTLDACVASECQRTAGQCLSDSFTEDFDNGFVSFVSLSPSTSAEVDIAWSLGSGSTPSSNTGPPGDHTTGSGMYAFTEASSYNVDPPGNPDKRAILESGCIDLRDLSAARFEFFYHMLGADMGTLEVEADPGCDGAGYVNLFTQVGEATGDELNGYARADIDLGALIGSLIRLRVVATTGAGYESDIAVDDLNVQLTAGGSPCVTDDDCPGGVCDTGTCVECLDDGDCGLDEICDVPTRSCIPAQSPECTSDADCDDGDPCTADACSSSSQCHNTAGQCVTTSFTEDFEGGFVHFASVPPTATNGVDIPWSLQSGTTPSSNTGPPGDHSSGSGIYAYTEASSYNTDPPGSPDKRAVLQSGCIDLRGVSSASFTFFLHMLGADMGSLEVQADADCDGASPVVVFTQIGELTGTELNGYARQDLDLAPFLGAPLRLRIVATTGDGYQSDIAVDDLSVQLAQSAPGALP